MSPDRGKWKVFSVSLLHYIGMDSPGIRLWLESREPHYHTVAVWPLVHLHPLSAAGQCLHLRAPKSISTNDWVTKKTEHKHSHQILQLSLSHTHSAPLSRPDRQDQTGSYENCIIISISIKCFCLFPFQFSSHDFFFLDSVVDWVKALKRAQKHASKLTGQSNLSLVGNFPDWHYK